jgi:hypothetical protein
MQAGYKARHAERVDAACRSWQAAWQLVVELLQQHPAAAIEDVNQAFHGQESLTAWARDFETALEQAGQADASFHQVRVAFCQQYLARTIAPGSLDNLNLLRAIGESHFRLGHPEAGDAAFRSLTGQYPQYSWGWLGWANMYGLHPSDPWHSAERAAAILRLALAEPSVSNRPEIVRRLREILLQLGRPTEASLIE